MAEERKKREPLPLSALDDAPVVRFPSAAPAPAMEGATKPVAYAPPPPSSTASEPAPPAASEPAADGFGGSSTTKPTPYTPPHAEPDAQGYAVRGFSRGGAEPKAPDVVVAEATPRGRDGGEARFGDAAGEHLAMRRGKRSAWAHVGLAFLMEGALFALPIARLAAFLFVKAGLGADDLSIASWSAGGALGLVLAYAVFRGRFRCIEALASRYVVDADFVSVLWAPFIAFGYANLRAFRKLAGR
jgi:hypothetical protein